MKHTRMGRPSLEPYAPAPRTAWSTAVDVLKVIAELAVFLLMLAGMSAAICLMAALADVPL